MVRGDLKSNDARRAASMPHLKVSLEYVDQPWTMFGGTRDIDV